MQYVHQIWQTWNLDAPDGPDRVLFIKKHRLYLKPALQSSPSPTDEGSNLNHTDFISNLNCRDVQQCLVRAQTHDGAIIEVLRVRTWDRWCRLWVITLSFWVCIKKRTCYGHREEVMINLELRKPNYVHFKSNLLKLVLVFFPCYDRSCWWSLPSSVHLAPASSSTRHHMRGHVGGHTRVHVRGHVRWASPVHTGYTIHTHPGHAGIGSWRHELRHVWR